MDKKSKKQLTILSVVMAVIAIGICIALNTKPKVDEQKTYIDTSDIEETSFNWEDITHVEIFGYEGNIGLNITYDEIPEFQNKLEEENNKWKEKRLSLDTTKDAEEIKSNLEWLEELNKAYDAEYCSAPSDLNNYKVGDTVKITCGNKTLEKLNYKFNDGFEITLENIFTEEELIENEKEAEEGRNAEQAEINKENIENNASDVNSNNEVVEVNEQDNYYDVIGNSLFITVYDANTVNLIQTNNYDEITVVVDNQEDFETIKEKALALNNIDYIQIGMDVYDKESNFTEAEEWKGVTGSEE